MNRCRIAGLVAAIWMIAGLGLYELTAKSPRWAGVALPGWWATDRAERAVVWRPPTGVMPLDRLLHEGQEAAHFYASLVAYRSRNQAPFSHATHRNARVRGDAPAAQAR